VVLKGLGAHHHTGGLYDVNVRIALPDGREVDVARTPQADERHSDLVFAPDDAFKRARRKLQDHVRRLQGQVKHHDNLPIGTVARIDPGGEFGFIESSDGREVYFHRHSGRDDPSRLAVGSRVSFAEEIGEKGPQADHCQAARKASAAHMNVSATSAARKARWEHFPHDADVGIRGFGATAAEAFEQAALALTAVVTQAEVRPLTAVEIRCEAPDLELLFVEWLNAVIYEMAVRRMVFGRFAVRIVGMELEGTLWGESVDVGRHAPACEPKGATYTALRVAEERDGVWSAACIVDV